MKGKYLKKWMSVFLSTALAISSISGCGNSDKEPTDSTDKSANETTDTANKDTASDEASDVQDGDTPLIGSWIDLSSKTYNSEVICTHCYPTYTIRYVPNHISIVIN